ncbi:hypothetical protein [Lacibacter sediminis]|uniref:Uncharacterized protein n=1 Tax=Lacibacter sediminis TaxID=2760713 RepID=A0A7G5XGI7_9BACT|nr:hypothetical protein [Lacibacter sediminis]QNA44590.1 hypothetical protein H4075_21450 [Lacibacter sediminis]
MKKLILSVILFAAVIFCGYAQNKGSATVSVERVADTDSIWISLQQTIFVKAGTLMVVAKAMEADVTDTLYYPVIDTLNSFLLTVPENFQNNKISISTFYYPGLRQITGTLNNNKISSSILMFVFGKDISNYNKVIEVKEDKHFVLPKLVFENKATVFFNFLGTKRKQKPDIAIELFPKAKDFDSVTTNVFDFGANLFTSTEYDSLKLIGKLPANAVRVEGKGKELQQIIVTGTRKTKLEKYKEQFNSGLFESIMEREYNFLENDEILTYADCINYLITRMAGLSLGTDQSTGEQALFWRKEKVKAYFIDEMEVDFNQVQMLDLTTIAYMKFLPTLLAGSMNPGNGGAVVVYTRKGEFIRQGSFQNNYIFSIKGYTPSEYILFSGK